MRSDGAVFGEGRRRGWGAPESMSQGSWEGGVTFARGLPSLHSGDDLYAFTTYTHANMS